MAHPVENVPSVAQRKIDRVLIEYDGPQLVQMSGAGGRRYLGYVADELDGATRWLQVPVSALELKALHLGKLSLREALEKEEVVIYDVSDAGEVTGVWIPPVASIPEECLPDPGVELPEFARDPAYATNRRERLAFECEGSAVSDGTITFRCLAAVTGGLQHLWFALAKQAGVSVERRVEWNAATLAFAAGGLGSFAIEVDPRERATFDTIAAQYKRLVHASYRDRKVFDSKLAAVPDLSEAFGRYAEALDDHGVDVFADWESDAVFLGNDQAKRVAKSHGRRYRRRYSLSGADERIETAAIVGYFDGFMRRSRRFDFVDSLSGENYTGQVDRDAAEELEGMDIVIGRHAFYRATIETTLRDGEIQKCLLVDLERK